MAIDRTPVLKRCRQLEIEPVVMGINKKSNRQPRQRRRQLSEYGTQLREKQKAKFMYGLNEKQFRNLFKEASRKDGNTGSIFVQLLEQRLDNVVYRMGFATTRRFARQLVSHGHILVDGKRVDIPSYRVFPGQKVEIIEKSKENPQITRAVDLTAQTGLAPWVDVEKDKKFGLFTRIPEREEIQIPIEERFIVELYSK